MGLEDFVNWVDSISSKPVEEREDDMSSLAAGFDAQICKRANYPWLQSTMRQAPKTV